MVLGLLIAASLAGCAAAGAALVFLDVPLWICLPIWSLAGSAAFGMGAAVRLPDRKAATGAPHRA